MDSAVEAALGDLSAGLKRQLRQALEAELATRREDLDRRERAIRERELALDTREQQLQALEQVRDHALSRVAEEPALKERTAQEAPAQPEGQNPQAPPTTASRQVEIAPVPGGGDSGSLFSPDVFAKPGSLFAPATEASKQVAHQAKVAPVPARATPPAAAPSAAPQETDLPAASAPLAVLQKRLSRSLEADEEANAKIEGSPLWREQEAAAAQPEVPKTGGLQWVSKPVVAKQSATADSEEIPAASGGAAGMKGLFGEEVPRKDEHVEAATVASPASAEGHASGMKKLFEEKAREARKSASAPDSRAAWKQVNNQLPLPSNQGTAPFRAHEAPFKRAQTLLNGKAPPPRRSMQELLKADEQQRGA